MTSPADEIRKWMDEEEREDELLGIGHDEAVIALRVAAEALDDIAALIESPNSDKLEAWLEATPYTMAFFGSHKVKVAREALAQIAGMLWGKG